MFWQIQANQLQSFWICTPTAYTAPAFGSSICSFSSCSSSSGFWGKKNKALDLSGSNFQQGKFKKTVIWIPSKKFLFNRNECNLVIKDNTTKIQQILIFLKIKRIRNYSDMQLSSNYKPASINREYSSKPNSTMQRATFNFLSMLILLGNMLLNNEVIFVLTF